MAGDRLKLAKQASQSFLRALKPGDRSMVVAINNDAEVVALCIDLGQPADDFDAVRQKALDLGAVESLVVDAKEEFARDYVAPAIRANGRYQGGYPLFTSLGRPLLAKLACDAARTYSADTIAHGRPHPLAEPFALDRFTTGALVDEHGAAGVAH